MNLKSTGGEGGVTLKPCPCGEPAKAIEHDDLSNCWRVECTVCTIRTGDFAHRRRAEIEWNTGRSCAQDAPGVTVKRWPFVESPGEFADRLTHALSMFGGYVLGAVRNVLIENPPQICADYLSRVPPAPAGDELTVADYEEVLADHRRLVRELDVALNGDGAAKQASLVDIVAQVTCGKWTLVRSPQDAGVSEADSLLDRCAEWMNVDGDKGIEGAALLGDVLRYIGRRNLAHRLRGAGAV